MVRPIDFTVRLERVFQGPMDLLLHLVREHEMDVHEIEISTILKGYLAYLEELEELDVEFAADFLVMAATLMAIKSRSLLPAEEVDLDEELDPRDELIQRLVEYRRFKGVADDLEELWNLRRSQAERGAFPELGEEKPEREYDLGELTAFDLASVFARLRRETLADHTHHVASDPRPLRFYVETVVDRLREAPRGTLRQLVETFGDVPRREAIVGSFCALLELVKLEVIDVDQEATTREIRIALREGGESAIDELLAGTFFEGEAPSSQPDAGEPGAEAESVSAAGPELEAGRPADHHPRSDIPQPEPETP